MAKTSLACSSQIRCSSGGGVMMSFCMTHTLSSPFLSCSLAMWSRATWSLNGPGPWGGGGGGHQSENAHCQNGYYILKRGT